MEMEYPHSGIRIESTLTEKEKWFFDLQGFLVIRQAISPNELADLQNIVQDWMETDPEQMPAPTGLNKIEYGMNIVHPQYGHKAFERLAQHPNLLRMVMGLMWNRPRLFISGIQVKTKRPLDDKNLMHKDHSGFEFPPGFRNPHNDYQVSNGKIYSNFVNVSVALTDVPPDMGFACVPGSHKSDIKCPSTIHLMDDDSPAITFPLNAGDAIIFSPNLIHGAKPWTADHPRITVFNRYQFSFYFNENPSYPMETHKDKISEAQYELESGGVEEKTVVKRILAALES